MQLLKPNWVCHDGMPIYSIDVHPDGSRFVTGGQGKDSGRVVIWNFAPLLNDSFEYDENTPKMLCQIDSHQECVNCVRWSMSGKYLASCGDDKLIMIWSYSKYPQGTNAVFGSKNKINVEAWRCTATLRGHTGDVLDLAWSPQDIWLASASVDNTVIVWDAMKFPVVVAILKGHTGLVKGVTWDPVGKYLSSQSDDRSLRIWKTVDWQVEKVIKEPFTQCAGTTIVLRHSWSPDGQYLLSAHAMNNSGPTSQVIERNGWKYNKDYVGHRKAISCVRFSNNILRRRVGKSKKWQQMCVCALGSRDLGISIWLTGLLRPISVVEDVFKGPVLDMSWSYDCLHLLSCSYDGTVAYIKFSEEEIGRVLTTEQKNALFERVYGTATIGNLQSGNIVIENADLISNHTGNKMYNVNAQRDRRETEMPTNSNSRLSQPGINKQIETKRSDGKRRITPIFVPALPDTGEAPVPFKSENAFLNAGENINNKPSEKGDKNNPFTGAVAFTNDLMKNKWDQSITGSRKSILSPDDESSEKPTKAKNITLKTKMKVKTTNSTKKKKEHLTGEADSKKQKKEPFSISLSKRKSSSAGDINLTSDRKVSKIENTHSGSKRKSVSSEDEASIRKRKDTSSGDILLSCLKVPEEIEVLPVDMSLDTLGKKTVKSADKKKETDPGKFDKNTVNRGKQLGNESNKEQGIEIKKISPTTSPKNDGKGFVNLPSPKENEQNPNVEQILINGKTEILVDMPENISTSRRRRNSKDPSDQTNRKPMGRPRKTKDGEVENQNTLKPRSIKTEESKLTSVKEKKLRKNQVKVTSKSEAVDKITKGIPVALEINGLQINPVALNVANGESCEIVKITEINSMDSAKGALVPKQATKFPTQAMDLTVNMEQTKIPTANDSQISSTHFSKIETIKIITPSTASKVDVNNVQSTPTMPNDELSITEKSSYSPKFETHNDSSCSSLKCETNQGKQVPTGTNSISFMIENVLKSLSRVEYISDNDLPPSLLKSGSNNDMLSPSSEGGNDDKDLLSPSKSGYNKDMSSPSSTFECSKGKTSPLSNFGSDKDPLSPSSKSGNIKAPLSPSPKSEYIKYPLSPSSKSGSNDSLSPSPKSENIRDPLSPSSKSGNIKNPQPPSTKSGSKDSPSSSSKSESDKDLISPSSRSGSNKVKLSSSLKIENKKDTLSASKCESYNGTISLSLNTESNKDKLSSSAGGNSGSEVPSSPKYKGDGDRANPSSKIGYYKDKSSLKVENDKSTSSSKIKSPKPNAAVAFSSISESVSSKTLKSGKPEANLFLKNGICKEKLIALKSGSNKTSSLKTKSRTSSNACTTTQRKSSDLSNLETQTMSTVTSHEPFSLPDMELSKAKLSSKPSITDGKPVASISDNCQAVNNCTSLKTEEAQLDSVTTAVDTTESDDLDSNMFTLTNGPNSSSSIAEDPLLSDNVFKVPYSVGPPKGKKIKKTEAKPTLPINSSNSTVPTPSIPITIYASSSSTSTITSSVCTAVDSTSKLAGNKRSCDSVVKPSIPLAKKRKTCIVSENLAKTSEKSTKPAIATELAKKTISVREENPVKMIKSVKSLKTANVESPTTEVKLAKSEKTLKVNLAKKTQSDKSDKVIKCKMKSAIDEKSKKPIIPNKFDKQSELINPKKPIIDLSKNKQAPKPKGKSEQEEKPAESICKSSKKDEKIEETCAKIAGRRIMRISDNVISAKYPRFSKRVTFLKQHYVPPDPQKLIGKMTVSSSSRQQINVVPSKFTASVEQKLFSSKEAKIPSDVRLPGNRKLRVEKQVLSGMSENAMKLIVTRNETILWETLLGSTILSLCWNDNLLAISLKNRSLCLLDSGTGKYTMPVVILNAKCNHLQLNDKHLLCITDDGSFNVWDVTNFTTVISNQSLRSVLVTSDSGAPELLIRKSTLANDGTPLLVLSNGVSYMFSLSLRMWLTIGDAADPIISNSLQYLRQNPSRIFAHEGSELPLHSMQCHLLSSTRNTSRNCNINFNTTSVLATTFLERQLSAALVLQSAQEYRHWLLVFVRYLLQQGEPKRLRNICEDLLGPRHPNSQSSQQNILGIPKHQLLREVLNEIGCNLHAQRLYTEISDQLNSTTEKKL